MSHKIAPAMHAAAAAANEAVHPQCLAINGVSDAVVALPICPPMFMNPDSEPDDAPPTTHIRFRGIFR